MQASKDLLFLLLTMIISRLKLLTFLRKKPANLKNIMRHLYLKSIGRVVVLLVTSDGIDINPDSQMDLRVSIIKQLHEKLSSSTEMEE